MPTEWDNGYEAGRKDGAQVSIELLKRYLALTQEVDPDNEPTNPDWDAGFSAAIAILTNPYNWQEWKK